MSGKLFCNRFSSLISASEIDYVRGNIVISKKEIRAVYNNGKHFWKQKNNWFEEGEDHFHSQILAYGKGYIM